MSAAVATTLSVSGEASLETSEASETESMAPDAPLHHLTDARLEEIEAAAYARGQEAAAEAARGLEAACAAIEKAGTELARAAASDLAANREATLALAADIARAWVGRSLSADTSLMGEVLDDVLGGIEAAEEAQIFLPPSLLAEFETQEAARIESWSQKFDVVLRGDPALSEADFRVETSAQYVDGRLDTIRARMIEALAPAVEAKPPEEAE